MLDEWLSQRLADRKHKGLLRMLPAENNLVDFTSNDYLGLARSDELYDRIRPTLSAGGSKNGSTGSRLLSGNSSQAEELEEKLAGIFQSPSALIFNSGYSANVAVLSSIPQKGDTILYDDLAHASIKDGARLSLAKKYSFRHNDLEDLDRKIKKSEGRIFVVVESIYSMDGDECPLAELVNLSTKRGFSIVLDEAHSTGVRGPRGAGISVEKALHDKIDIRIYTFGKAMGACGACVAGSHQLRDYLVNFSRPFIYTTAPSPHTLTVIGCAFDFLAANMGLQQNLERKIAHFLKLGSALPNRTPSSSAIQTFLIPGNENARAAAARLQKKGFDVRPILSPTVREGTERLRLCLHAFNSDSEITSLTEALYAMSSIGHPEQ